MKEVMERTEKAGTDCKELQTDDAKKVMAIINSVPENRRGFMVAVVSAYIDGITAGEAMATGGVG